MINEVIIKQNRIISGLSEDRKELVEQAINKAGRFFEAKIDFKIIFLETREEMDGVHKKFLGMNEPTEDWVVGGVFEEGIVHIFSKDVYDKVSCHPKETFFPTLVHEIAHVFTGKLFRFHFPIWLNEGISYVVADQDNVNLSKKQDITKAYTEEEWFQTNPYLTSGKFTRFLLDKYGKEKVFSLLRELDFHEKKSEFYKDFKKVLGDDFNGVWKSWFEDSLKT